MGIVNFPTNALRPYRVFVSGSLVTNGATDPDIDSGVGFTATRTGVGVISVNMNDYYDGIECLNVNVFLDGLPYHNVVVNQTSGGSDQLWQIELHVYDSTPGLVDVSGLGIFFNFMFKNGAL